MSDENQLKEILVKQEKQFLHEQGIFRDSSTINDLILFGFIFSKTCVDVEIELDEKNKILSYFLYYRWYTYPFINENKIEAKLREAIIPQMKGYRINTYKMIYKGKKDD